MKQCTASTTSLTYAMKAHNELLANGIDSVVVKLDSSFARRGCTYGIEFSCNRLRQIRHLLNASNIPVSRYVNGSGGEII